MPHAMRRSSLPGMRAVSITCVLLAACFGKSNIDIVTPTNPPVEPIPAGPEKCLLPGAQPVKALLRVSNYEYQQLAADVLGAPVSDATFARWTPVPQVFGYDTMSQSNIDSQSLTEQLRTAEQLTARLLATPELLALCPAPQAPLPAACTQKAAYDPLGDFSQTQGAACWSFLDSAGAAMAFEAANSRWESPDHSTLIWSTGMHPGGALDAVRRWLAPQDGSIILSGEFKDVDPGGGDGVTVFIKKNGAELWRATLPNASGDTFELRLSVKRGDTFDFVVNRTGDPYYDTTAFNAAIAFTEARNTRGWTWDNCARPIVERVAGRMQRRPLRAGELADYQALYATAIADATTADLASPTWAALETVVQAALATPSVMYKAEVSGGLDEAERGYEIASRLSLFFCSSYPDDELWSLAAAGSLSDPKVVEAQANRLLTRCLTRFASNFAGQWFAYRARIDAPDSDALTPSMRREAASMFASLIEGQAMPVDLLSPGYTLVDQPLASHYGLPFGDPDGSPVHRIATTLRGGLFTQGYFLTSTAKGSDFKRVIDRGIWTLNRVLCRQLPPLNAATREEIASSFAAIDPKLPLSEKMKLHRSKGSTCIQCHSQMDPIGLALEKYDAQGLWRDAYPDGSPIKNDFQLDGVNVSDPMELASEVKQSFDFRECVVTQMLTYGLQRVMNDEENECVSQSIAYPIDHTQPTLRDVVIQSALTSLKLTGGLK